MVRRLFIDNAGTWLMSIILAVIVWGFLYNDSTDLMETDADIDIRGVQPNQIASWVLRDGENAVIASWSSSGPLPAPVERRLKVRLSGAKGSLRALDPRIVTVRLRVDSALLKTGSTAIQLQRDQVSVPQDLSVVYLPNSEVRLDVIRFVEQTVILRVPLSGDPRLGYEVKKPVDIQPGKVRALIPETRQVEAVRCKPLTITDRVDGFAVTAEPDEPYPVIFIDKPEARVDIGPKLESKTFVNVPVRVAAQPSKWEIALGPPSTCSVTIQGEKNFIDKLQDNQMYLFVIIDREPEQDEQNYKLKVHCQPIVLELERTKMFISGIEPESIDVKLKRVR